MNPKDGLLGFNQFAYCHNNPIAYSDPDGHSIILACIITFAAVGAIAGGGAGAYLSYKETGEVNGWAVAAGAVAGGVIGGFVGWGVGAAITAAGVAGAGTATGTISQAGYQLYNNWQNAEAGLRQAINSVVDYGSRILNTPMGNRVVDAYNTTTGVIAEAKYGYQAYSSFVQSEIARDAWLLQTGAVSEVQWHFYYSQASQTIGGSYNLIRALLDAGIQVFYH